MSTRQLMIYCIAVILSLLAVLGAGSLFFVNPLNWKDYKDYQRYDLLFVWTSNIAIIVILLITLVLVWRFARTASRKRLETAF